MHPIPFFRAGILCGFLASLGSASAVSAGDGLDRSIGKEPEYRSTPKYSLITLGDDAGVKVWMVEDGKRLFVDRNANGDLTDDGPALEPSGLQTLSEGRWGFRYLLDAIVPNDGSRHPEFILRRWNYDGKEDCYGLSLSVGGKLPMYAGWFGTFWSTTREQAPVIHFGGPFTPKLLRRKAFTLGETQERLSLCFVHPGSGPGAESRLSIEALPRFVVPRMTIEWPVADGAAPLQTSQDLMKRCCYWEFYETEFELPKGVVAGNAKINIGFGATAAPIELTTTMVEIPVVPPSGQPASK
jgi:hypothetical protein